MNPIQEIHVRLANGDLVDAYVEAVGSHYSSNWRLIAVGGTTFQPSRTPPVIVPRLAFEALVHAVAGLAAARQTTIATVENPCGDELVSRSAQEAEIAKQSLGAAVTVNGT